MDLRQLRYFVAVAEELHFSRAATRLNLAQSALSSQVRRLEREIGGPLLVRRTRRVELTPAGEALLADAHELLAAADGALARARALARGESGVLMIGLLGATPGGILSPLLARFSSRHRDVHAEVHACDFSDAVGGVRDRYIDCAFVYLPVEDPELEVTPLLEEDRVVVLPRSHRLARRRAVRPADLVSEPFVSHPDTVPQAWRDYWLLVAENGTRPPISPHIPDRHEDWLHLIARGEGIDTAPAVISQYFAWPEIAYVPLVDAAPCTFALARRRDNDDALVAEFRQLASEAAAMAAASDDGLSLARAG